MSTIEQQMEARQARRMASENRYHERMVAREDKADQMIGELCREGRTVHYVYPAGGKYREGPRHELIAYLIRNRYA